MALAARKIGPHARLALKSLDRTRRIFGLESKTETGAIFGISRQALDEWYTKGVPMSRVADVGRVASLADALRARFVPERLPQIVREPLPGLGGESILRAIRAHGTGAIFDLLDRAFSYIPSYD